MKNEKKNALIFGISGQDGSYLAKYLISKNYKVFGISRRKNKKINHLKLGINRKLKFKNFDYCDYKNVEKMIVNKKIDEIYFLAGQTKPSISNSNFLDTLYSNVIPVYNIIDIIIKNNKKIRFFHAASCEIFKNTKNILNEKSVKEPHSIYGLSKLISFEIVKFFRKKYNLKICSGILFHHESLLRNKKFVLRKVIISAKNIFLKKQKNLELGNVNISRDWGWAPEYVKLIHKMNNQSKIEDLIIATGRTEKLKMLIKKIFNYYGLDWKKFIKIDKFLFRKNDSIIRKADNSKIRKKFNWTPSYNAIAVVDNLLEKKLN